MGTTLWPADPVDDLPEYSAIDDRRTHSVLVGGASAARPLGARSGVRPGTPATTVEVSGGYWKVKPHGGCMDVGGAANGPYLYATDAATDPVLITAAHGSWSRVDVVYARLDDPGNGDATTTPQLVYGYEVGTPLASNPLPPSTWAGVERSMVLAYVDVPPASSGGTGSASVRWVAPELEMGIVPVRTAAERDAVAATSTSTSPVLIVQKDTGQLWMARGSGAVLIASVPITVAPTMSAGWTLGAGSFSVRGGVLYATGLATKSSPFANGDTVMTLPPGSRPPTPCAVGAWQGNGGAPNPATISAEPNGIVQVWGQTIGNTQLRFCLTWPAVAV